MIDEGLESRTPVCQSPLHVRDRLSSWALVGRRSSPTVLASFTPSWRLTGQAGVGLATGSDRA